MRYLKEILVASFGIILLIIATEAHAKKVIVSPRKGNIWFEGETYTIKWRKIKDGVVCIAVLIGGHYTGIINDCDNCASQGKFRWKIPLAFVSGFGENRDDRVRIVLYYKDNESNSYFSDYFTISK